MLTDTAPLPSQDRLQSAPPAVRRLASLFRLEKVETPAKPTEPTTAQRPVAVR